MTAIAVDVSGLSRSERTERIFAIRSVQGDRTIYTIQASLLSLPHILPAPDPDSPAEGNRRVNLSHAKGFGAYLRDRPDWIAPPLIVRDSYGCQFEHQGELPSGAAYGILVIPWHTDTSYPLAIIDGQHRVLGVNLQLKDIRTGLAKAEDVLATGKNPEKLAEAQAAREYLEARWNALRGGHFTIQIYVERDPQRYKQMFFDVADNARGINKAITTRFDGTKVINRTMNDVLDHPLLVGRVDEEQDSIRSGNKNLMGAKHVADMIRTVAIGITGRMGTKREQELTESGLVEPTRRFLDCLLDAFPDLQALVDGTLTPVGLRERSLLGSVSFQRVLAGVYHQLLVRGVTEDEVRDFFSELSEHMPTPVPVASIWRTTQAREDIAAGASGVLGRAQNFQHLTETIVGWYPTVPPQADQQR